ncbi:MAG: nitroreductase [Bacteroidia bacterium]|nr:nitroreductase [Bacteroidia bacterium]
MKEINEIIRSRRSIFPKEFTGKILDDGIIDNLLLNANYAPNHKSNYPWRFVVIKDLALNNWLDKAAELYRVSTHQDKFKQDKFDKILAYKHQISHSIAIVLHRDSLDSTIEREDICAVACGVQNMYLTLSVYPNVGGYWSTGLGTYDSLMHEFLHLEENESLMGYFVVGHVELKRTDGHKRDFNKFVRHL